MSQNSFIDKNFNFSDLTSALVVAEVCEMQSSIAVFAFEHNQFVRIDILEKLFDKNLLAGSNLFETSAKQKMVMFSGGKILLVPSSLFDTEKVSDLFKFNFEDFNSGSEKIFFNKLNHLNVYLLFSVDNDIVNPVSTFFPERNFYHRATAFLETGVLFQNERLKNKDQPVIFVDVLDNSIILSLFFSEKLVFFNQIAFKEPQDFVFFMVKVADKFKLNTKKTEIFLSGRVNFPKDELLLEIKKFFLQVYPFEFTRFFGVSPALKSISLVRYNSLFNLPFCV